MDSNPAETGAGHQARPKRVLLVEDDDRLLELMSGWLRRAGHIVVPCNRFEKAKDYLATENPDVLVTDVRLGAYNGLQLAVFSKAQHPTMRIIVLTGFDDPVLRQEAATTGASYLVKPISAEQLVDGVNADPSAT